LVVADERNAVKIKFASFSGIEFYGSFCPAFTKTVNIKRLVV